MTQTVDPQLELPRQSREESVTQGRNARLRNAGYKVHDRPAPIRFEPLKTRPAWLAFVLRKVRRPLER